MPKSTANPLFALRAPDVQGESYSVRFPDDVRDRLHSEFLCQARAFLLHRPSHSAIFRNLLFWCTGVGILLARALPKRVATRIAGFAEYIRSVGDLLRSGTLLRAEPEADSNIPRPAAMYSITALARIEARVTA